jgi:hypothetical protein
MKVSQALTAGALILFLVGNYLYMAGPINSEAPASQFEGSQPLVQMTKHQLMEAESAIRRLQSEMATTNALLDRKSVAWKNDLNHVGSGLRGHNPSKDIAELNLEMKEELLAQTGEIANRLSVIDKDLTDYASRVTVLPELIAKKKDVMRPSEQQVQAPMPLPNAIVHQPISTSSNPPQVVIPSPAEQHPAHISAKAIPPLGADTPLLMICFQRADYLERSLGAILANHPGNGGVPIVVSQDGSNADVIRVVQNFKAKMNKFDPSVAVVHMQHQQGGGDGYHKLAQHYGWALNQVFTKLTELAPGTPQPARVIIMEEDLEVAPDFFDYFAATSPLLDDPSENLLAVSAWNDNGQEPHVKDSRAIFRSSFFPGLGWMINRKIWTELSSKWPQGYWDDWLREPAQQVSSYRLCSLSTSHHVYVCVCFF